MKPDLMTLAKPLAGARGGGGGEGERGRGEVRV